MSHNHEPDTPPPFTLKRDGSGASLTWKGFAALISFISVGVAAYMNMRADMQDHIKQLSELRADVAEIKQTVNADHDTLTRTGAKLDSKLDTLLRAQRLTMAERP